MGFKIIREASSDVGPPVYLATVAIGTDYFVFWERHSLPNWNQYAQSYGYGIAVLTESSLSDRAAVGWNKFLLPRMVAESAHPEAFTLALDADQIFSPIAPRLSVCDTSRLGLVHVRDWSDELLLEKKLTAALRRHVLARDYPLDSTMVMSEEDWRSNRILDLDGQVPISSGFILVPPGMASRVARLVEFSEDPLTGWDGGGGDQQFASREFQRLPHAFLDRRWQGIWPSIMAQHAAYLYLQAPVPMRTARAALVSALMSHWCIHFATSWPEKEYWGVDWMPLWEEYFDSQETASMRDYIHDDVTAKAYGRIAPPDAQLVQGL